MTGRLGFIGAGNMAGAIIGGILKEGGVPPGHIGVYDIAPETLSKYDGTGVQGYGDMLSLVQDCDTIVLAVKPQVFPDVMPYVRRAMTQDKLIVSIAAGITAQWIQEQVGFPCRVVLVMPNTPLLIGEGAAALSYTPPATQADLDAVMRLFSAAGIACEIDPAKMKEIIPVHGSSPAFIYLLAKTIVERAEKSGIDPDTANRLFCKTLIGSAKMMLEPGRTHQELIDMVCSPGGTTLAALEALDRHGFTQAIDAAFDACVKRAYELSK